MIPPLRNRINLFFADEKNWLLDNNYNIDIEYDIPALDKLKNSIKNEFMIGNGENKIKEEHIIPMIMKFYNYIDDLNIIFSKYSPCKGGCSNCCLIHIVITDIEKSIINNYIENNKLMYKQVQPNEILSENEYCKKYNGKRCPFLEDKKCLIYPVRPFACRRFICLEYDNSKCEFLKDGIIIQCMEDDYIFRKIFQYLVEYNLKNERQRIFLKLDNSCFSDIRDNYIKIIDK
jgi:Fe-S-cluster containining protein